MQRPLKRIAPELMNLFMGLEWRGNVRELENLIMRGISFSAGADIRVEDVGWAAGEAHPHPGRLGFEGLGYKQAKQHYLEKFNQDYLGELLSSCKGNVSQAARTCGLERQALQQIMRRYRIRAEGYRN
jgi:DNA-binding NtrC family response regulator